MNNQYQVPCLNCGLRNHEESKCRHPTETIQVGPQYFVRDEWVFYYNPTVSEEVLFHIKPPTVARLPIVRRTRNGLVLGDPELNQRYFFCLAPSRDTYYYYDSRRRKDNYVDSRIMKPISFNDLDPAVAQLINDLTAQ